MSDTRLLTSIIEAIRIITDKKISQASFDKTVKAIIKGVSDLTTGLYIVKYQDSQFVAYATSSEIHYKKGDLVFILIPGNDWSRVKTIVGGTNQRSTTFVEPVNNNNTYNAIGKNGIYNVNANLIQLNSHTAELFYIYKKNKTNDPEFKDYFKLDQNSIKQGVKESGGLAVGAYIKTKLEDSQFGVDYGLIFNLLFSDSTVNNSNVTSVRPYVLNTNDVIGNPYLLNLYTYISSFIDDINVDLFIGIDSIQAYCSGINIDEIHNNDIFIKDIQIQAAKSLTSEELVGYSLNIDYSQNGKILGSTVSGVVSEIKLKALLKAKGKIVTKDVEYYWFRENGMILRGNSKYSAYGGDGWLCVNWSNGKPVPYKDGNITFINGASTDTVSSYKGSIALFLKNTNIKCVAVYGGGLRTIEKTITLINNNIINSIYITSSDKINDNLYKTIYYLDNGHPTLTCQVNNAPEGTLSYEWYLTQSNGVSKKSKTNNNDTIKNNYYSLKNTVTNINNKANKLAPKSRESYLNDATNANNLSKWKQQEFTVNFIDGNKYVNFPINSILNSKKISCVVYNIPKESNNKVYIGTASITLYNKQLLAGMYSVVLNNGSQVFHYDGKGNSPASPQIERPILIQPLTFGLLDKDGTLIPFEQIIKSGLVDWIIPNTQTLLTSNNGSATPIDDAKRSLVLKGMTLPLAANNYNIYRNISSFHFTIANKYDEKKNYNDILLHIKYKDLIFDTYTNFSFPKQGDPGTNGTDYVAKIVGKITDTKNSTSDRLYISNQFKDEIFDDNGTKITKLLFLLYNNSVKTTPSTVTWSILKGKPSNLDVTNIKNGTLSIKNDKVTNAVDIIRAQVKINNELNCFTLIPICTNRIKNLQQSLIDSIEGKEYTRVYRIKVAPKTGFKYVMYSLDGIRPDYDNSLPFEIIVENYNTDKYFEIIPANNYSYTWNVIGNLRKKSNTSNKAYIEPILFFNGLDLTSAVLCTVKKGSTEIGTIHIPIYMYLNRYGHTALNKWDGNSIELGDNNGGTILAPQVGAGKKGDNSNTFTGILMGTQKTGSKLETGLFGYNKGQRSIFLDADTGNAYFGKDTQARINIGADNIGIAPRGSIYSGNYYKYDNDGKPISLNNDNGGQGMLINLTNPLIKFGSGKFSVNTNGLLTAKGGGFIAGWTIRDNRLYKANTGMASSDFPASSIGATLPSSNASIAFYASNSSNTHNFYVTHGGYLFSKSGKIGGWSIGENTLSNNNVGMNSKPGEDKKNKAFYAGLGSEFYVRHDGYLFSKSGNIAGWGITEKTLLKILKDNNNKIIKKIGLGEEQFGYEKTSNTVGKQGFIDGTLNAKFWSSYKAGKDNIYNFIVDLQGRLFSNSGYIGGWTITNSELKSGNIIISSKGSIKGNYKEGKSGWTINSEGKAIFNDILANKGTIGSWYIIDGAIQDATTASNSHVRLYVDTKGGHIKVDQGYIGKWEINGDNLTAGSMYINGDGSLEGPSWSIDKNGNANFNKLSGTLTGQLTTGTGGSITGGGGGGTAGGWTMPSSGNPKWNFGKGEMIPRTVKVFKKLNLKQSKASFNIPLETAPLTINITGGSIPVTITGTDSLNGTIKASGSIKISDLKNAISISQGEVITKISDEIDSIVTGWGTVETEEYTVMASELNNVSNGYNDD